MKKTAFLTALMIASVAPATAQDQESDWDWEGSLALVSDFRDRGISITDKDFAVVGTLNTFLIPQLGRSDLDWWFWKPKRHEVAVMSGDIIVMFSPGDSDRLPEYAEQGLLYDDCSVLRFRRSSVGLCIGGVDPEVRDTG